MQGCHRITVVVVRRNTPLRYHRIAAAVCPMWVRNTRASARRDAREHPPQHLRPVQALGGHGDDEIATAQAEPVNALASQQWRCTRCEQNLRAGKKGSSQTVSSMPRSTFAREAGHAARGQRCVSCTSTTQQAAIGRGAVCRHTRWHNTARVTQTSKRTVAPAAMAVPATPKRPGAAYVSALSLSRVRFSPDMGSSSNRSLWAPGFIAVTCSAPPLGGRDARGDAAIGAARGCYQGHGWGPMRVSGSCYPTITPESNSHDAANKGAAGRPRILLFASGVWIDIASSQSCHNFSPADTYHQAAVCSYVQTCAFKTPFARPAFHFPYADG